MVFLGWCVLVLGALGVLAVIDDVRLFLQVRRSGVAATADVVGVATRHTGVPGGVHRYPLIRFTTADATVVTTELRLARLRDARTGDRVYIQYLPKRPRIVNLWDADFRFLSTLWTLLACGVLVAIGVRMISG